MLARTPQELVAANVSSSTLEGRRDVRRARCSEACSQPRFGVDVAVAAAAVVYVACAVLVRGIRRAGDVSHARRRVERRHGRGAPRRTCGRCAREPHPRLIVLLFAAHMTIVRGVLNVLLVVVAFELMERRRGGRRLVERRARRRGVARRPRRSRPRSRGGRLAGSVRHRAHALGRANRARGRVAGVSGSPSPASASSGSGTRSSTSRASRCSSAASTSTCSAACSVSSRSPSRRRSRSDRCSVRCRSRSTEFAGRSSSQELFLPAPRPAHASRAARDRRRVARTRAGARAPVSRSAVRAVTGDDARATRRASGRDSRARRRDRRCAGRARRSLLRRSPRARSTSSRTAVSLTHASLQGDYFGEIALLHDVPAVRVVHRPDAGRAPSSRPGARSSRQSAGTPAARR